MSNDLLLALRTLSTIAVILAALDHRIVAMYGNKFANPDLAWRWIMIAMGLAVLGWSFIPLSFNAPLWVLALLIVSQALLVMRTAWSCFGTFSRAFE